MTQRFDLVGLIRHLEEDLYTKSRRCVLKIIASQSCMNFGRLCLLLPTTYLPQLCMYVIPFFAVTDFSFVSSAVGVPFATSINALTVTSCGSATRYV